MVGVYLFMGDTLHQIIIIIMAIIIIIIIIMAIILDQLY